MRYQNQRDQQHHAHKQVGQEYESGQHHDSRLAAGSDSARTHCVSIPDGASQLHCHPRCGEGGLELFDKIGGAGLLAAKPADAVRKCRGDPRLARPEQAPTAAEQRQPGRFAGWPPLAGPLRERTNSRVYVPLLLAAAGLLDQQEAAGWSTHPLAHDWWQPTVEALQQADPVPAETFAQGLEFAGASPGAIYAVIAAGGGARPGHVHLPPVVRALADSAGYIHNLAQDLLLELFGGVVPARGVDRRADPRPGQVGRSRAAPAEAATSGASRREAGQQRIPKEQLLERFTRFEAGDWAQLLTEAQPGPPRRPPERDANGQSRAPEARRGRAPDENEELRSRCERARELIRLGEVSAARQALTASAMAPGTQATLDELRDPARRLQQPREQLSERAARAPPQGLASLEPDRLLTNVRGSRRGAAPGPSGMTGEHLQTLLDDEHCCDLLHHAAALLARAEIPGPVAEALRLGRLTALRKSNGGCEGLVVLGAPIGHGAFVAQHLEAILEEHRRLLARIPHVGDLQSSWLLLSMCANPRANFFLRALAPEGTAAFAAAHDDNLANALADLLELPQEAVAEGTSARQRCQLPLCMGGLGLRSASRTAPAAWWASWADCAQMLRERCPELTNQICAALSELDRGPLPAAPGRLQQASRAKEHLSAHGFAAPNWHLAQGARPPPTHEREHGEWAHGWQFWANGSTAQGKQAQRPARARGARGAQAWRPPGGHGVRAPTLGAWGVLRAKGGAHRRQTYLEDRFYLRATQNCSYRHCPPATLAHTGSPAAPRNGGHRFYLARKGFQLGAPAVPDHFGAVFGRAPEGGWNFAGSFAPHGDRQGEVAEAAATAREEPDRPPAPAEDANICVVCQEVIPHHGAGRDTPTQEACCGAHFHLGCRADLARHLGEATTCPQCRARLPITAELRAWCAAQGVDIDRHPPPAHDTSAQAVPDYNGFRSYARGEEPPPREPPLLRALCCRRLGPPPEFSEVPDRRMEWSPEIAASDTNGMITQWLESWLCPRCGARCAVDTIAPQSGQQMCARCLEQGTWTAEASTAEGPVLTGPFVQMLAYTDARPGEVPAVLAADGGERPGHVSFAPVAQAVAHSSTGYIQPLPSAAACLHEELTHAQTSCATQASGQTRRLRRRSHRQEAPQEPELPGDQHANGPAAETDHEAEPAQAPAPSNGPTEESWAALGSIDLQQELRRFVPTLQNVPRFLRAETRMAFTTALKRIKRGHDQGNQATTHQGWTLFLLASRLLLSKPKGTDAEGRQELLERAQRFRQGDWLALLHEANTTAGARAAPRPATEEQQQERRREQACAHGTAAGPSGVRVEHLKPLLEHEESMDLLGFAAAALAEARSRLQEERRLLDELAHLPDLQCAWLLLLLCASPRANHLLRTLPPEEIAEYARGHDGDMWATLRRLLGDPAMSQDEERRARALAAMPGRHGGLGLQSAARTSPAAYWGAWADALHMLHQRRPVEAAAIRDLLDGTRPGRRGNLAAAAAAAQLLETEGFRRPSWTDLLQGLRPEAPPRSEAAEPGEWQHGWQFHACSARNTHYRDNVFMPSLTRANQAMLRSGSGPRAAYWLHTLPTTEGHVFKPARFLAALRRRLRLPLPLLPHACGAAGHPGCRARLDTLGDHLAACPRTGLLARRAKPLERAWARVAREAGGRVVPQQLLRDTNAVVHNPLDRRQLDLVVYGISPNGVPLCCDSTMVSPLRRDGWHRPRTFDTDGAALLEAERRKRRRYHEFTTGHSGRLMVLSCEVGGRWGRDSLQLVRLLAKQKARAAPALLRRSAELAYTNRWWGFLSVAAQDSLMATLTGDGYLALGGAAGEDDPDLAE
ncbi:unnamed protein product, partial [Prorocentrum cordatum]